METDLLQLYKSIYHKRVDMVTVKAFLIVLKGRGMGWHEISKNFRCNNTEELLQFLKERI